MHRWSAAELHLRASIAAADEARLTHVADRTRLDSNTIANFISCDGLVLCYDNTSRLVAQNS